mmetsp:Transcript_122702/g.212771  ORF Transcript_122702/g.212771 Transcript_122702/m.212771 type:complete len:585 (-) Transcript_122702:179-1933(-)
MQRPPSTHAGFGGMRPPSGGMPGAGYAPPGSRAGLGTAYQPMVGMGNALNTQLEVTLRPVTKEGLGGIAPGSLGPGRQVADRSYYLGILRSKNVELQAEIQRLKQQEEAITKSNANMASMDGKAKNLQKEVNDLKNLLSDYNFAVSKAQSGADLNTLKSDTEQLKAYNLQQSEKCDQIFLEGKQRDAKAKELENQIRQQLDEMDQKLNAEPEKKEQYYSLRQQSQKLMDELLPKQRDLEFLQRKHKTLQAELKADQVKQAAMKLQERKEKLEQKKKDLVAEIRQHGGTLPDEKSRLLNQVKSETAEIENLQAQMETVKAETQKVKEALAHLESDLSEYRGDRAEKYKELEAKDREMQDFIDKFDDAKKTALDDTTKCEERIVHLLEQIGKNMQASETLPSQQQVQEMSADLEFKKKQMDFSVSTHERLKNELELRKKELEKVDNLDSKITNELEAITEKIKSNEEAIKKYSNLEALRQDADQRKRDLLTKKTASAKLRDALKTNVHLLTTNKYEPLRQSLQENEVYAALQAQENKIRLINQTVFSLSDFIAQKGSEADYLPLKAQCLSMCEEINQFIQEHNNPK